MKGASGNNKTKGLKYKYALDADGNVVYAENLTSSLRDMMHNDFYVEGWMEDGSKVKQPVMAVVGKKNRPHFRAYASGAKHLEGFIYDKRKFGETIVHKTAKQVLSRQQAASLLTPDCYYVDNNNTIRVDTSEFRIIDKVEIEKTFKTSYGTLRYDAFLTDRFGRQIGVEILVTHQVDKYKAYKIQELGHEVIEIDLSDIPDNIDNINVESEISTRINKDTSHTKWVSNRNLERFKEWKRHQVRMDIYRAAYSHPEEKDSAWFVWAADYIGRLNKCPHLSTLIHGNETHSSKERYLEWKDCLRCGRCSVLKNIGSEPKKLCGTMACNQSNIPNQEILAMILKGIIR